MSRRLRCAIYTRKSTEEGLDQAFNSLHAQREACEAYVLSQTGEGWSALKAQYDDGGFSGGSMSRPGLQQLLTDIRQGLIDVVVVYKVDRLTRSLADFAKIVESFDAQGVSFVSVTQAFNTTTSMGRLTLNVLLSFAQFEREVTGERIRDKVAASKAKGLRMGGRPPLGYDIRDGRLAINQAEAPTVRRLFDLYLELGSIRRLEEALRSEGIEAKRCTTKEGAEVGGGFMGRGPLNHLLCNPAYIGVTRHKDKRYPDTHPPIISQAIWDQVQARLASTNARQPKAPIRGEGALLDGKLFDDREHPMIPVHTARGARRYRYYVSRAKMLGKGEPGSLPRISAGVIESFLADQLAPKLASDWAPDEDRDARVAGAIEKVILGAGSVTIELRPAACAAAEDGAQFRIPFHMGRSKGGLIVDVPGGASPVNPRIDRTLVRAVVLAKAWARDLETGAIASVKVLAKRHHLCLRYTARLLPLGYLAPDLTAAIIEGRQPRGLTLSLLTAQPLPPDWSDQRRLIQSLIQR